MSNILDNLLAARRRETVLSTGRKVAFHYPDPQECLMKVGKIPLPALAMGGEVPTEAEAIKLVSESPETVATGFQYTRLMVAAMLDGIDGDDVQETDDRLAIVDALEPIERQELFLIADRQKDPDSGEA
jgi:hypothetical protein